MVSQQKVRGKGGADVDGFWGTLDPESNILKGINKEKRIVPWVISSQARDRDGDVVGQKGLDVSYYLKNPVILYSHRYGDLELPTLGRTVELTKELDRKVPRTVAMAQFLPEGLNAYADGIYRLVTAEPEPFIKMASIGFMTNSSDDALRPGNQEEREAMGLGPWGTYFERSELLEWSVCPIGSNRDANRKGFLFQEAVEKGIITSEQLQWIDNTVGGIWQKMGVVRREKGLLVINEEYHEWLARGAAPVKAPANVVEMSMNDPKAFAEYLQKHAGELREHIRQAVGFIPEEQRRLLLAEAEKISQKISPAALTQVSIDRLQSTLDKAVGRFQASDAPGRLAIAGGVKHLPKPDESKGIDLYGNDPDGA